MDDSQFKQFQLEKELSKKLLNSTAAGRKTAYKKLYAEFFEKFPNVSCDPNTNITHKIEWQKKFLQRFLHAKAVFLEIGAGNCLLSLEIAKKVKTVIAYEVAESIPCIKNSPENFYLKIFNGVDFLEFDNSVDIIYSNDVFEHLHIEDAFHHANQYYNMLTTGGKLIIVTPHLLTGPHDISRNFSDKPEGFHMKEYTYKELRKILSSIGFKKIKAFMGHKTIGYFSINIWLFIFFEKIYDVVPRYLRYKLKNNFLLQKIFSLKIVGQK